MFQLYHGALLLAVGFVVYRLLQVGKRDPRMPPGPPTLPLIGNLHQVPLTGIDKKFVVWAKQYGSVFSLKFGPENYVILCDKQAVHELMDKKGNIYSDRPSSHIINYIEVENHITMTPMTPAWREKRKIVSHNFSPKQLDEKHFRVQEAEASWLMNSLLEHPEDIFNQMRRYTASVAASLIYGFRAPSFDSFWAKSVYHIVEGRSETLEPGAAPPLDQFPFLKYVPTSWALWKRRGTATKNLMLSTWAEARRRVEERREQKIFRTCVADTLLDEFATKDMPMSDKEFTLLLGEMMEAGADTTASQLLTLALAFALHPEVQKKARTEIDAVCGASRAPLWSDFKELPYINAIVKEGMRWRPTAVVPVPHKVREDDYYKGMFIPKGSTVIIGMTSIHRNNDLYEDAENFNPDRYLGFDKLANDYAGSPDWEGRDHYGYGAGRRICPGIHFAERSMWRVAAKLLWAFEFSPAVDPKTNKPIPLDANAYTQGMLQAPLPYVVKVKVRSEEHLAAIKRELAEAKELLSRYE